MKVEGCSLQLLPQCTVPGVYKLVESSSHAQSLSLTSRDALYAEAPFSVASLGAHLEGSGSLDLRYVIRGLKVASAPALHRAQLGAGCESATHMIINYAVGAYELGGSSSTRADAEAKGFGASAGGGTERGSKAVFRSGDLAKCETDPKVCTAPVRLRLVPIDDAPPNVAPSIAALATQRPHPSPRAPGGLSSEVIEATIRSASPSLRACLEHHRAHPDEVALNIAMSIGEDGTVLGVELFRPIPALGDFVDCARDALRSLRFPPTGARMTFTRMYNFRW